MALRNSTDGALLGYSATIAAATSNDDDARGDAAVAAHRSLPERVRGSSGVGDRQRERACRQDGGRGDDHA
jgi:hypothetical protein